jgi:hypothetical protein
MLLVVGFGTWLTACSESLTPLGCSDVGCFSGLTILLEEPLPDGTVVSLLLENAPWTVTCGVNVNCSEGLYFEGLRAEHFGVRVTTPSVEVEFGFRPEYKVVKPNGPDCPPDCFHAEITLPALDPS